ncbi:MAG: mechanosensitive ion channel [Methylococcaceae bacterium]|nr:mechanosensitive ion channel [Methylococcaceae bacterium]
MKIIAFSIVPSLFWWAKKPAYPTLLLLLITLCSGNVFAESPTTPPPPEPTNYNASQDITKDSLQAKIDALTARKGLDEALKSRIIAAYQSAQDELNNIKAFNEREIAFKTAIQQAPDLTKKLQKDIDQASEKPPKPNEEDFVKIPVEELTQRLVIEQDKVKQLDEQISKLTNELTEEQNNRPNLIRQERLNAKQELDEANKAIQDAIANADSDSDAKLAQDAQKIYLKTQIDAKTAKLNMLDAETLSYAPRLGVLKTRLQLLGLQKEAISPVIDTIENVLSDLQQQEEKDRQNALSQAEKDLAGKPLVIQEITRENIQYSQQLQTINGKISHYNEEKATADKQISDIDANFSSAAKKIDLASLSPPLGKILHEQRRNLLSQDKFVSQSESIQTETATTNLGQLAIEEKLKKLDDFDGYLQHKMELNVDKKLSRQDRMKIQAELRVLLNYQVELLNKLSVAYNSYLRTLGDFDFVRQQRHNKVEKFALYLDERLLWVRSSELAFTDNVVSEVYRSTLWLLSPTNWNSILKNVANLPAKNPFLTLFALLNITILLLAKNWAKRRLKITSAKVGKIYTDNFHYTLEALGYTLILVAPLPLTVTYIGWLLSNVSDSNFTQAVGLGLNRVAIAWFFLQFFYRLFEPTGIMRNHFQWQEDPATLMRTQLAWIRFVILPCGFIIRVTLASGVPAYSDNLGRLALNISLLAVVLFLTKLLHPRHGLLQHIVIGDALEWTRFVRYFCYLAAFSPLIIIGFSVTGYYLSALELQQQLMVTLALIFIIHILYEIALRWLTLANRQLVIKNLQQKRKSSADGQKHVSVTGSEDPVLPIDDEQVDIPEVNAQTKTILNVLFCFSLVVSFWMIWKNIFPAFSFLERIELWQNKTIINNKEVYQSITLVNLFLAGIYSFITVVSVRNFSGVTELLIFRRVSMEAGSRYAVNQLAKYTLTTIGFFCFANELGFNWSQVQWLVAALSVGLGFGLQEIFANFVSGIILLFERPIRVGDTVTIGNVSGKVSRIHMRATTLIDFDQKELIVPNKTFITTQLVNWTLSDAITRVVITVGIPYGSDIELAHKVMLDAVCATPLVLKDPEPSVMLIEFSDSALTFSVRVFVSETANRIPVTHALHIRLAKALSEHNIDIPFPQRDIHIRSIPSEWCANKAI